ncbi:hypothetical protein BGW36DRAFT_299306 [Talaromyces proteolyticus]|uniref:Uncharacterized protein n=1 Tax=Talaromyces proteolyticus TaxID=1131652 RepID=A0AAD4KMX4_9EURO|nr:uncharacterized protein BGW36DRAFT_299306 [Talaromyces proteolyticus]KAH8695139.1 hypothetical protein BGW36DRAFT_299306 [Talaromyces proteolyticus]
MSKYAASAPGWVDSDESPIDKYFRPRPVADEKAPSQAAFDLEFELERIIVEAKTEQTAQAPRSPRSPQKEEHVVAPLNVVTRKSTSASRGATAQAPPALAPPRSRQSAQPGDLPPYKLFPSNTTKHARLESNSSAESDASAPSSMKPSTDRSASTKTVSRRLRSSLRLPPNLRRQRPPTPQLVHEEAEPIEGGSLVSLEDDQAALAKSTDRYIDAQIAKALDVASEEDSDNLDAGADGSESDKKSNNINPQDEGEWSTIYPLKAVKKLGIPLMSSSHIPRLSSSDNEKSLRLQLPKLNTIPPSTLVKPEIIPQPPPASVSKYPETPDDVGLHTRSFIVDSPSVQSPIEEENEMGEDDNDAMPHSDKIFIELNHVETVTDEMSPKTQEVPLTLTVETRPHHSRRQSKLYELDGNGSTPVVASPNPFENVNLPMPSQMPEKVVISLMENVNNLEELFNYALLNKQFYRVFKANELSLIKNALFQMSPPAWELREMSPPWTEELEGLKDPDAPVPEYTPESYLRHYGRDMIRLAKLKSLILARCGTIVRPETIAGLAGSDEMRADEIDEAFWRIWTFCRIFGCGKNRESDVNGQMDWLNGGDLAERNKSGATVLMAEPFFSINNVLFDPPAGFGKGNGDGLTHGQLYDMIEIWLCLGVLLQVIHGESKEARIAGVFEGMDISPGDILKEDAMLEEWTYYILTLGPSALVTLSSVCPTDSAQATFAKAKQMGVTRWEPPEYGATRQAFLREAITRTYEIRIAPQQNAQTRSASNGGSPVRQNHSAPIDNRSSYNTMHSAREPGRRPDISFFNSEDSSFGPYNGAPPYTANNTENLPAPAPASGPPPRYSAHETFIDPVDRAIRMMVHDLGFSEHDAKWALKITDTGDMLDTDAAVRLLQKERKRRNKGKMTQLWRTGSNNNSGDESGPENLVDPLVNVPKHSGAVGWRWG